MPDIDFYAIFIIGLLGGFSHCIGMCGGFVFTYTIKISEQDRPEQPSFLNRLSPHLLYSLGRVVTYSILGELFGLLGGTLTLIMSLRDFQGGLQLAAGLLMVVMGFDLAGWIPKWQADYFPGLAAFKRTVQGLFARVNRRNVFVLGLVLGLVPCGLVYAMGARAAASASPVGGMLIMLVFGLGTVPAMVLTGLTTHFISGRLRGILYRLAAVMIILLGLLSALRGIDALGWAHFLWLP